MNLPVHGSKLPRECLKVNYFVQFISQWSFFIFTDIDIASDADDIACGNIDAAVKILRTSAKKLFKLLKDNQIRQHR